MLQAPDRIDLPLPLVVEVAELAVLVALGISRLVFLPQEHQGDGLAAQFPVDADEVRRLSGLVAHDGSRREHELLQLLVIGCGGKGPTEPGGGKAPNVFGDGASGDGAALGDLEPNSQSKLRLSIAIHSSILVNLLRTANH